MKVALIGLAGAAFAALIPIGWGAIQDLTCSPEIELTDVVTHFATGEGFGMSGFSVADVKLRNSGSESGAITDLVVAVEEITSFSYDACPICLRMAATASYDLTLGGHGPGDRVALSVLHEIGPGERDRLRLVFGGGLRTGSHVAKVRIGARDEDGRVAWGPSVFVLVFGNDDGRAASDGTLLGETIEVAGLPRLDAREVAERLEDPVGHGVSPIPVPAWVR